MNEREIFLAAIDMEDPAERAAWVAQACGSDAELRTQVEQLLKSHDQASQFLETPAGADSSAVDRTVLSDASDTDEDSGDERTSGEAEFGRYLEPATRPGWLGRLAHYEIEEILGRGAFGIVAKAFDEKLHRVVAIKLMNSELASTSPPRKRFLREARTAAAVTHENIVAIHAVEEEPIPYLVMEYIPGRTLQQRMDDHGPLDVEEVLRIGQQVAAGLAAAHAVQLIHRDIKPSNILLSDGPGERAKISDFGLARAVDDASLTSSGLIAGTPMYMAPEQARGETLDHRADLFSLGSVLYQMASGRPPFRAANTVAVLKRVCDDTPRPLKDVIPGTPAWLQTIIFRLLEKDREDRYQTAQEVADLLARCQRELEHNGQVTCVDIAAGNAATQVFRPQTSTGSGAKKKPLRWLAGGVIAVAVVIGLLLLNRGNESANPDLITDSGTAAAGSRISPADSTTPDYQVRRLELASEAPPAISEDGSRIVIKRGRVQIIDLDTGGVVAQLSQLPGRLAISPDGTSIATGDAEGAVILWDEIGTKVHELIGHTDFVVELVFSTNGKRLLTGSRDGTARVWNVETGELVLTLDNQGDEVTTAAFSPDGRNIVTASNARGGHAVLWDGESGEKLQDLGESPGCMAISFVPGARKVFAGTGTSNDLLIDLPSGERSSVFDDFDKRPASAPDPLKTTYRVAIDQTGRYALSGTGKLIILWDLSTGQAVRTFRGHTKPVHALAFLPGGRQFLSASRQGSVRIWRLPEEVPTSDPAPPPAIAPFDVAQAKAHQAAWAKYLDVPVEYENSIGMKFRLIPPGEFLMGSTSAEIEAALKVIGEEKKRQEWIKSEGPNHRVILTQPVYVGVTEVTQTQYEQVMGLNPSHFSATGEGKDAVALRETGNHPVERVSWNDAAEFCAKLSQQDQLTPLYFRFGETVAPRDGTGYRLPTEAEWEFACRAGTTTRFWSGDTDQDLVTAGWYNRNSGGRTHAAGELKANPFGLFDVHGNVWEWVQDSWDPSFYGKFTVNAAIDPYSPFEAGSERVDRGGGLQSDPFQCCSSVRFTFFASTPHQFIGFRVALPVDAVKQHIADEAAASPDPELTGWHGWPAEAPPPAIAPFDAAQAKQHQEAWAKYLGVPVEYENSIGMKFRLIPPGEFLMGSTPDEVERIIAHHNLESIHRLRVRSEAPQRRVTLTQPYYLSTCEVSQKEFEQITGQNPSAWSSSGRWAARVQGVDTNLFPVESVTWNAAVRFCNGLGKQEGLEALYDDRLSVMSITDRQLGYRLPTEAEWEYACRAGSQTRYWTGDQLVGMVKAEWRGSNSKDQPHPVGQRLSNPFGMHDMHGNSREWCQDAGPTDNRQKSADAVTDPVARFLQISSPAILRGGDFHGDNDWDARSAVRHWRARDREFAGFRVRLSVDAVKQHIAGEAAASPNPEPTTWHGWPADAPPPAIAPFDAAQAKQHQAAWAKYLGVPVEYENSIGMKFRLIPPGEFTMGGTPEEIEASLKAAGEGNRAWREWIQSEATQHRVILTQPVYVGVTEVMQTQYEQVMGTNPSYFSPGNEGKTEVASLETGSHPVESVSWNDAAEFCARLSEQEELKPFYFRSDETVTPLKGTGYRLPTEAEWESACRAGTRTRFWSGDEENDLLGAGWFVGNSGKRTHAVGELGANPYGLSDVHGNVREWVQDSWQPELDEALAKEAAIDASAPFSAGLWRVIRGGGWGSAVLNCRSANRNAGRRGERQPVVGFRVVLVVDSPRVDGSKPAR